MPHSPAQSALPGFSRELQLLLCCARTGCARTELADSHRAQIRALVQPGLDWPALLALAQAHAVLPLLYRNLRTAAHDLVPDATLRELQRLNKANAKNTLGLTGELLRLLKIFKDHNIPAIPFKGPTLAVQAYGDVTLRSFVDLDILLHRADLDRAEQVILLDGYEPCAHVTGIKNDTPLVKDRVYYKHGPGGIALELHWRPSDTYTPSPLDGQQMWEKLDSVHLLDETVPCLRPADLLLLLAEHGGKHAWLQLSHLCDMAELLRHSPDLRLGDVLEQARRRGCRRKLLTGLALAATFLDQPLASELRQAIERDPAVGRLVAEALHRLTGNHQAGNVFGHVQTIGHQLRSLDTLRDRAIYSLGFFHDCLTPNATDRDAVRLPRPLRFLYYPLPPPRLALTYGRESLRYLFGRHE